MPKEQIKYKIIGDPEESISLVSFFVARATLKYYDNKGQIKFDIPYDELPVIDGYVVYTAPGDLSGLSQVDLAITVDAFLEDGAVWGPSCSANMSYSITNFEDEHPYD